MWSRFEASGFMSLYNTTVDLNRFTIFVGGNAAGKSALFRAMEVMSRLLNGARLRGPRGDFSLEPGVTLDSLVHMGNSSLPIKFRCWLSPYSEQPQPDYEVELVRRPEGWSIWRERFSRGEQVVEVSDTAAVLIPTEKGKSEEYRAPLPASLSLMAHHLRNDAVARKVIEPVLEVAAAVGRTWRYRPSADDIAAPVRPGEPKEPSYVRSNGRGLAWELQKVQGERRDIFERIEEGLRGQFSHVKNIGFRTDHHGVRLMYQTTRSQDPLPAAQESDGVLVTTFVLWRLYTAGPGIRVCFEEPENGLHPFMLPSRFAALQRIAEGEPPVQVLVSTHSPAFLKFVKGHHSQYFANLRTVDIDGLGRTQFQSLRTLRDAHELYDRYADVDGRWGAEPSTLRGGDIRDG